MIEKANLSDNWVTNISKSFTHKTAAKTTRHSLDMEWNYVTGTLCIDPYVLLSLLFLYCFYYYCRYTATMRINDCWLSSIMQFTDIHVRCKMFNKLTDNQRNPKNVIKSGKITNNEKLNETDK